MYTKMIRKNLPLCTRISRNRLGGRIWLLALPLLVGLYGCADDANVVIINYDILGKWRAKLRQRWDVLIADECHYVKNKDAKRSKRLYALTARRKNR